ncbi:MAG TPA: pyruvate, phosphate dikinase, partial [Opitutae bacterium]|nr:pyruvate, phosphate dikinase [Opitutae bacterium]
MPQKKANKIKYLYAFGKQTDGSARDRELLGGKGANLAEMARIGLPVPPGFTLTTDVCSHYYAQAHQYPRGLEKEVQAQIKKVEAQTDKRFGDVANPLLVSVRSGARESMPGMMDTILNLGLNDKTVEGLAVRTQNPRFAYDAYRRFIQMYGDVVLGVRPRNEREEDPFDQLLEQLKSTEGVSSDSGLSTEALKRLILSYKKLVKERTKKAFPQDVYTQLWGAIGAVFISWNNERARLYRQKYNIPADWGTAVNVQAMVFGNMGNTSATGVAFTRNPANGAHELYGEYLINAQGEDVVAGVRTPSPIQDMKHGMPDTYASIEKVAKKLEAHFKDMQDFEFTVEAGKLYMLQTRSGKRTGLAAVRIATSMVKSRLISEKEALKRIPADSIGSLLVPVFDAESRRHAKRIAKGLPAGPGAASGVVVFSAHVAEKLAAQGEKVILCRRETSPEDLRGMMAAEGILTLLGGVSSHAALVARQMGKVCIAGAGSLSIDYEKGQLITGDLVLNEGDAISIDGNTGDVFLGSLKTAPSEVTRVLSGLLKPEKSDVFQLFNTVMGWADKTRRLKVRTNVDTPDQAQQAVSLGAEGIGLCRTEHMFFEGERITIMRQMILAADAKEREASLKQLLPLQRKDFAGIFRAMGGRPVTIRLLDPPLHEFLPKDDASRKELAQVLGVTPGVIAERVRSLEENNPMLGHRGCRLGITYPEITQMQVQAIFEAAAQVMLAKKSVPVLVEIMVPLVAFSKELDHQVAIIRSTAESVMQRKKVNIQYSVGTMVEVPRAALDAESIAHTAEFFSFGTNDLT